MRHLLTNLPTPLPDNWPADKDLRHRLDRVLRLQPGAELVLSDGRGQRVRARYVPPIFYPLEVMPFSPPPAMEVTLAAGLIKGERWDWLVEKATELGAHVLQPLACEHSVVRIEPSKITDKTERWQSLADEANEQCGRAHRCMVAPPRTLAQWLAEISKDCSVFYCDERETAVHLFAAMGRLETASQAPRKIALVVGPEGGLSQAERDVLISCGATGVCISNAVLRAETAALTALVIAATAIGHAQAGSFRN